MTVSKNGILAHTSNIITFPKRYICHLYTCTYILYKVKERYDVYLFIRINSNTFIYYLYRERYINRYR